MEYQLPLRIETGRYVDEKPNQRICNFCDGSAVEDEALFLLSCPHYNDIRRCLLDSISNRHDLTSFSVADKFSILLDTHPLKVTNFYQRP